MARLRSRFTGAPTVLAPRPCRSLRVRISLTCSSPPAPRARRRPCSHPIRATLPLVLAHAGWPAPRLREPAARGHAARSQHRLLRRHAHGACAQRHLPAAARVRCRTGTGSHRGPGRHRSVRLADPPPRPARGAGLRATASGECPSRPVRRRGDAGGAAGACGGCLLGAAGADLRHDPDDELALHARSDRSAADPASRLLGFTRACA